MRAGAFGWVWYGPGALLARCGGTGLGAAYELVEGVGEVGFTAVGVGAGVGHRGAHVVPGAFTEGPVDVVAVDPGAAARTSLRRMIRDENHR